MPDLEKVIKDLEDYRDREFVKEGITIFDNDPHYRKLIINNAIDLLKEQDKKIEELEERVAIMAEGNKLIQDESEPTFDDWTKKEGR